MDDGLSGTAPTFVGPLRTVAIPKCENQIATTCAAGIPDSVALTSDIEIYSVCALLSGTVL